MTPDRRTFLKATTLGMAVLSADVMHAADAEKKPEPAKAEVSASEDLMREHGVLNRILLIYEEGLRRLRDQKDITPEAFAPSASLVRKFVEDYHERLEEKFIFPEFEKRNQLAELVQTLRQQHDAGRRLTDVIQRNAEPDRFGTPEARRELAEACWAFIRMYRPHEAREDTVLFPALHNILSADQLHELGEQFEEQEEQLFGEGGFEKTVQRVAELEKKLGIYELSQFTPR
jgi:hemerythrin-like domain-containing protein